MSPSRGSSKRGIKPGHLDNSSRKTSRLISAFEQAVRDAANARDPAGKGNEPEPSLLVFGVQDDRCTGIITLTAFGIFVVRPNRRLLQSGPPVSGPACLR